MALNKISAFFILNITLNFIYLQTVLINIVLLIFNREKSNMDGYIIAIIGFAGAVGAVILSNYYTKRNTEKSILNTYENKFILIEATITNAIDKYTTEICTIKQQLTEIKSTDCKIDELKDLFTDFKVELTKEISDIKADIKIINKK